MPNENSSLLTPSSPSSSSAYQTDLNSSTTNLAKYRRAIGINAFPDGDYDLESARKDAKGLYKQVILTRLYRARQHRAFEALFYTALGSQIIIGAALTALGPSSKAHSRAITVLGIFNTCTAGLLTVLKGQGLPDRFRKDEYEMKKVQDFIEEMDVRLSVGGADTFTAEELDDVVREVFQRYNVAVDTAESRKPASWARGAKEGKKKGGERYSLLQDDGDEFEDKNYGKAKLFG